MYLKYIGNKPIKRDSALNSGTVWAGKGDVQEVSEGIGEKLKGYTDIWCECDAQGNEVGGGSLAAAGGGQVGSEVTGFEGLDAEQLRAYALEHFNVKLSGVIKKPETLIEKIKELSEAAGGGQGSGGGDVTEINGITITKELEPLRGLAEAGGFSDDPEEAVSQAIDMLGGIDSGYYDEQSGLPKQEAVQFLVGEVATLERIDIVMASKA